MILTAILLITSPILALITLIALKELVFYIQYLIKYKSQNIPVHFVPIIGRFDLIRTKKSNKTSNKFEHYQNLMKTKFKGHRLVVINQHNNPNPYIMLLDPKLIGEFFMKEVDFFKRDTPVELPQDQGFLLEHGESALKKRAIFNNFFQNENLQRLTKRLRNMIKSHFLKLKDQFWKDDNREFKTYDLRKFFPEVFEDLVNNILFGDSGFPLINGETMPTASQKILEDFAKNIMRKPLNFFTMNVLHTFRILPISRNVDERVKNVQKEILKTLRKREKITPSKRGLNILDVMLEHNESCSESEKLSDKDFINNIFLFQIAGLDTSNNVTESVMKYLSVYPEYIKKLEKEEIPKIFAEKGDEFKYDAYYRSEFLNNFINETMRLNPVLPMSIERKALRNVKLGPYTIYKGTSVSVPIRGLHLNEESFDHPLKFNPDRFSKGKRMKRNTYLPFMGGKRACIGKYLAELVIRINVSTFMELFELEVIKGEEFENFMRLVTGVKDCVVKFRPRERK